MILYFSGTGNSKYAAEVIQEITMDEIFSINQSMKSREVEIINSDKAMVFVCPTYAWRIPRVVDEYIRNTTFKGNKDVYFVLTCGGGVGNAKKYLEKLCLEKGLSLKGFEEVKMPDNYIVMYNPRNEEKQQETIKAAKEKLKVIASTIKSGGIINGEKNNITGALTSGPINSLFYKIYINPKGFHATEKCISCGKCTELCPLNNIKLVDSKPVWGDECTHCMACIARCPKEAIEYKNKTKGRRRYYFNK